MGPPMSAPLGAPLEPPRGPSLRSALGTHGGGPLGGPLGCPLGGPLGGPLEFIWVGSTGGPPGPLGVNGGPLWVQNLLLSGAARCNLLQLFIKAECAAVCCLSVWKRKEKKN